MATWRLRPGDPHPNLRGAFIVLSLCPACRARRTDHRPVHRRDRPGAAQLQSVHRVKSGVEGWCVLANELRGQGHQRSTRWRPARGHRAVLQRQERRADRPDRQAGAAGRLGEPDEIPPRRRSFLAGPDGAWSQLRCCGSAAVLPQTAVPGRRVEVSAMLSIGSFRRCRPVASRRRVCANSRPHQSGVRSAVSRCDASNSRIQKVAGSF